MKRLSNALPHIVIAVYTVLVSSLHLQPLSLRLASLLALLVIGAVMLTRRPVSPVVKGYLLYFALNVAGSWFLPGGSLRPLTLLPASILYGCFLAVALVPPLFGGPHFTEYFAKQTTPAAVWETDIFKTINRHMSWMWCGLFAASLVVGAIPVLFRLGRGPFVAVTFQILLPGLIQLGLGVRINKWYPAYYQRKKGIDPSMVSQADVEGQPKVVVEIGSSIDGGAIARKVFPQKDTVKSFMKRTETKMECDFITPLPFCEGEAGAPTKWVVGFPVEGTTAFAGTANALALPVRAMPRAPTMEKEETMSNRFRVVAINGSPHGAIGNTSQMTQMVSAALAAEGIDMEEIFLAERRIEFCVGCGVCAEKGRCWRHDDYAAIAAKALEADALILASPVYFGHVTAQMKAFLDRSLAYGHKPRTTWKPGLAISVSAGKGETATAAYLADVLGPFGAFSVGTFTSIAVGPGAFLGKEAVEARGVDLARDLARAIKEKRRYPATDHMLSGYLFMGDLVKREQSFMRDDHRHWQESGLYEGFESYVGQTFTKPPYDDDMRKQWIREMASQETAHGKEKAADPQAPTPAKAPVTMNCRDLIKSMPQGFKKEAAGNIKAVYQFDITGSEVFTAHLVIADGTCTHVEGAAAKADVVITSPAEVWLAVSRGEMNGQAAFMSGKYKVQGDLGLLMKLSQLFGA